MGFMNTKPRVFVGTLYCGEGDFDKCSESIALQKDVDVCHVVIENLPEKEAHNKLWQSWRDAKESGFDMFVKVDADTVLAHDSVLSEFWSLMKSDSRITGIQAPLDDYFTEGLINGLNCFSPKVVFNDTADELFCDRNVDVNHDRVIKAGNVPIQLIPAGYHCHYANDKQAFHFGLHRALKNQTKIISDVRKSFERHNDRLREIALCGAFLGECNPIGVGFNYNDQRFIKSFELTLKRFE